MSRSRVRRREELRAAVESVPALVAVLRPIAAGLRTLTEDATAAPGQRLYSRLYLRRELLKLVHEVEVMLDAATAPATRDPAALDAGEPPWAPGSGG